MQCIWPQAFMIFNFFMPPFLSISIIYGSINHCLDLDNATCFIIIFSTGIFKNSIMYPSLLQIKFLNSVQRFPLLKWASLHIICRFGNFSVDKYFTIEWIFVRDCPGISSGIFLYKRASFWSIILLTWDSTSPFVSLLAIIFRYVSRLFGFLP